MVDGKEWEHTERVSVEGGTETWSVSKWDWKEIREPRDKPRQMPAADNF